MLDEKKILDHVTSIRKTNKKIVFSNGCFDLLHKGHRDLIKQSLKDASANKLKNILSINSEPLVSIDFNQNTASSIIDTNFISFSSLFFPFSIPNFRILNYGIWVYHV